VSRGPRRSCSLVDALVGGRPLPGGRRPDEDELRALRAAIDLRAAHPAAGLPGEGFVARLRHDLAQELGGAPRRPAVSRRAVLVGAVAAAAGAAGVAAERALVPGGSRPADQVALDPAAGQWVAVANDADLAGGGARRFETGGLVGFVAQAPHGLVAVSGVRTHQGCLLRSNDECLRLECPCHQTRFSREGNVLSSELHPAPAPLPRLRVRRSNGQIEVLAPPP